MKGLLLKDLLNLKKTGRSIIFVLAFYALYAFMFDNSAFVAGMIIMLTTTMTITSFSYDAYAKWDKYALSLPITKKEMVLSKYILSFFLSITGVIAAFIVSFFISKFKMPIDITEQLLINYSLLVIALIAISILLPLIYKFGVEKSRILLISVFIIPTFFVLMLANLGISMPTEEQIMVILELSPLVLIIVLVISYFISVSIFKNKDL